jgi:hypothetical protein
MKIEDISMEHIIKAATDDDVLTEARVCFCANTLPE